jgi:hypothetical protein
VADGSSYERPRTPGTANALPGNFDRVKPPGIASANSCGGDSNLFPVTEGMRISSIDLVEGQAIQDALDCLVRVTKETLEFADSLVEVTRAAGRAWT